MNIDYKQLKDLVLKELVDGPGGMLAPSAPRDVPHRMPSADTADKEQDMGDPEANELYEIALEAREAAEKLVEALDDPVFDGAYESAFKASACLRKVLNELIGAGAHPMPDQRVAAAPPYQQKYSGGSYQTSAGDFAGGAGISSDFSMQEQEDALKGFGAGMVTQQAQAKSELERSKAIAKGDALGGIDGKERGMLVQIEKILTDIAKKDDLLTYRNGITTILQNIIRTSAKKQQKQQKDNK